MTLIEALQNTLRRLHYSPRTEEAYVYWTREFVRFHHRRHPRELGAPEVTAFLNDLAVLDRHRLARLAPPFRLIDELLYGADLRLSEALALRGKDVDIERHQITVRRGKGVYDRAGLLPTRVCDGLRAQFDAVGRRHRTELAAGRGEIDLPHALRIKMPGAATSTGLAWQYVFPASRPCTAPATRRPALYHLHETAV